LGSELLHEHEHEPTIARFAAEVSGRGFREFGARNLQTSLVERLVPVSLLGHAAVRRNAFDTAQISRSDCIRITKSSGRPPIVFGRHWLGFAKPKP